MLIKDPYYNFSNSLYNPAVKNLSTYLKILNTDSMVVYAYDFIRRGIASRIGEYSHPSKRIQQYVKKFVMPAIHRSSREILSGIFWGASLMEPVRKPNGKYIVLKKIYVADPQTWWGNQAFISDKEYELESVQTSTSDTIKVKDRFGIPQIAVYTYREEYDNFYGFPTAQQIYPYWYIKSRVIKQYAMYIEKFGTPAIAFIGDNDNNEILTQYKNMGSDLAMLLHEGTDIKILESGHSAGTEIADFINLLEKYILLSFYIPLLTVQEGVYSTRSQSEVHLDVYIKAETGLVKSFIEFLMEWIVEPMIKLNFGVLDEYGNIHVEDPYQPAISEWGGIIKDMKTVEVFDAGLQEHIEWASEKFGIEPKDLSKEIETSLPAPQPIDPQMIQDAVANNIGGMNEGMLVS